jgi:hypothetical protein
MNYNNLLKSYWTSHDHDVCVAVTLEQYDTNWDHDENALHEWVTLKCCNGFVFVESVRDFEKLYKPTTKQFYNQAKTFIKMKSHQDTIDNKSKLLIGKFFQMFYYHGDPCYQCTGYNNNTFYFESPFTIPNSYGDSAEFIHTNLEYNQIKEISKLKYDQYILDRKMKEHLS